MIRQGSIHIGTSGWHYQHWKGPFYPESMPDEQLLEYYRNHFQTVEINNTFYQLPERETLAKWRDTVPEGFIFSVKACRYITHMKKLKDPDKVISTLTGRIEVLGRKSGPVLFQLPPRWRLNLERLKSFLKALPVEYRYAFEFRDMSWFTERTEEALAEKGAAFCIYDFEHRRSPLSVTADFVYVRLHGPDGAYQGEYDNGVLSNWAEQFSLWAGQGKEIFCYFDNDGKGYAVRNASTLKELLKI
ncbi:MAG: DUF72 domain-containing protein [Dehalococcoidales bacterium]|nr:DUF72 domain-containing protein [Dehalococcoidales bacterium]